MSDTFDLRIGGGTLVDGSGDPGVRGDLGVREGRIVAMGKFSGAAREEIDATGLVVAPGFVDMHTHYDAQVFWDPKLTPSSCFGVTTVVGGNCGFSIAPLSGKPADAEYLMRMLARVEGMPLDSLRAGVPWNWTSFADYLSKIDGTLAINTAFMVGHSAMRRTVMGERAVGSAATPDEIDAMRDLLRKSIKAGGVGFSTTVSPTHKDGDNNPVPSRHATREEMLALARVVSEFEGTTLEILPNTTAGFDEDEMSLMTEMSLAGQRAINWNILTPDSRIPQMYRSQLSACDYAAARGGRIVPLTAALVNRNWVNFRTGIVLDSYPGWNDIIRLPHGARKKALADPEVRKKMDAGAHSPEAGRRVLSANWAEWTFSSIENPDNKAWEGKKVGAAAQALGKSPFDALLDIVVDDDLKTLLIMPQRGGDDESWRMLGEVWRDERTIIGASDAGAHLDQSDSFSSCMQLLSVGVRERKLLTLEAAVRELTAKPSGLIGLRQRGMLKVGNWADVVVFDPATVGRGPVHLRKDCPANGSRLYAEALGIAQVIVNGRRIVEHNQFTGALPGKVLHSGRDTYTVPLPRGALRLSWV